jgi:hypothetical protein
MNGDRVQNTQSRQRRRKRKYWNIYLPPTLFRRHCKKKFSFIKKIIYTFLQPIIELAYLKEKRKKKLINGC